ncbi:MAG: hypothetical protein HeimC3_19490 [Candidatus Heimdallarchaeota archaeon LC_3]|nr:MAG: hypothetical protein HeimC3_19490 [Candidatus Heimdallarchaeota archaeon LC_3]
MDEILSLYTQLINQKELSDPRIVEGVLFGLGMLNIEQQDLGIDVDLFKKLVSKNSVDWENKKALAFALTFVNNKKLKKKILNIARDFSKDTLGNTRKIGGLMLSFHESEKDLLNKYLKKPDKVNKEVLQGIYLGCALQRYTQFIPVLQDLLKTERNEIYRIDFIFSFVMLRLYDDPNKLSIDIMEIYKEENKQVKRILLESLSLLMAYIEKFSDKLKIVKFLINNTSLRDKYHIQICIIMILISENKNNISQMWSDLEKTLDTNTEIKLIKDTWDSLSDLEKIKHPVKFLDKLHHLEYHDVKLSTVYVSFFVDENLTEQDKDTLIKIITKLVDHPVAFIRDIAISRLLSFSLKYKTLDYLDYFKNQLTMTGNVDQQLYISMSWGILSEFEGSDIKSIYDQSKVFQNPIIEKGVLIGLGIASNPQLNIDWMDEKFLGFYEIFKGNLGHALIFLYLSNYIQINNESITNISEK